MFERSEGSEIKKVATPWLKLMDENNHKYKIHGWPEDITVKDVDEKRNRYDLSKLKKPELIIVLQAFLQNKVKFEYNPSE